MEVAFQPERVGVVVEGFDVPHAHIHLVPLYDREVLLAPSWLTPTPAILTYLPPPSVLLQQCPAVVETPAHDHHHRLGKRHEPWLVDGIARYEQRMTRACGCSGSSSQLARTVAMQHAVRSRSRFFGHFAPSIRCTTRRGGTMFALPSRAAYISQWRSG